MHKLTFTPVSYTGWGCLNQLLPEVERFKATNILIVTDPFLKE
ncbi:MAG: alcohol dehydrogenase, partial [Lysinibacillus fusiformis]|nr:alcohol dehydrogenase [Lysinibacillus fusiformis]